MASYVRTLCIALLATLLAACVSAPVLPQEPAVVAAPSPSLRAAVVPTSATVPLSIASNAQTCSGVTIRGQVLDSFNPADPNQTGEPKSISIPIPSNITADIQAAFDAAPDYFKTLLCGLAGIYITSSTPGLPSWGYRDTANPGNRYIALSRTALWPVNGYGAQPLNQYATATINALLPKMQNDPAPVNYAAAKYKPALPTSWPSDGPMTVLAVLAHEMGHIVWLDVLVPTPATDPDFAAFCTTGNFPRDSWTAKPYALRWQEFGLVNDYPQEFPDEAGLHGDSDDLPPADARISKLKSRLDVAENTGKSKDYKKARKTMARILATTRPWPSLFGAFSINEQFVEAFTLYTLLRAKSGLTSLALSIPDGNPAVQDIPATLGSRANLKKMLDCFKPLYGNYPTP
jgi:hypothetical protein